MRKSLTVCLVALLIGAVGNIPALCGSEKPIGSVIQAKAATLDFSTVVPGSTVYPGDTVATGADGLIRVGVGTSQFYLMANSSSVLLDSSEGIRAELSHGTAGFASDLSHVVELVALGAAIRS